MKVANQYARETISQNINCKQTLELNLLVGFHSFEYRDSVVKQGLPLLETILVLVHTLCKVKITIHASWFLQRKSRSMGTDNRQKMVIAIETSLNEDLLLPHWAEVAFARYHRCYSWFVASPSCLTHTYLNRSNSRFLGWKTEYKDAKGAPMEAQKHRNTKGGYCWWNGDESEESLRSLCSKLHFIEFHNKLM